MNIPEKNEKWFSVLFDRFKIKHKILSAEAKADLILANLIDEAMEEEGEIEKEKVLQFVRKHGV